VKVGDSLVVDFVPVEIVDAIVRQAFDPSVGAVKVWLEGGSIKHEVISWDAMVNDVGVMVKK
jgi:hypothetical protein